MTNTKINIQTDDPRAIEGVQGLVNMIEENRLQAYRVGFRTGLRKALWIGFLFALICMGVLFLQ